MELTKGQREFLALARGGENIFLSGGAGTGKTMALQQAVLELRMDGRNVIVCAATGTAAAMCGGSTIHRLFGLKNDIGIDERRHEPLRHAGKVLDLVDAIVIDEISMVRMDIFDSVAASLAESRERTGRRIQLIAAGDFFQLKPVVSDRKKERERLENYYGRCIGGGFAFQSDSWTGMGFRAVMLDQVKRQNDPEFVEKLLRIREGDASALAWFGKNSSPHPFPDGLYLCPTNKQADRINAMKLNGLPGPCRTYRASATGRVLASDKIVPDEIALKVGARATTVVNDPFGKYFNGSTGIVTELLDGGVMVQFDGRADSTEVPFWTWRVNEYAVDKDGMLAVKEIGSYTQLPIRLAYALTIHRAQGATYSKVNLNPSCWECGQLYVALSRVKGVDGLHLTERLKEEYLKVDKEVANFYKGLLDGSAAGGSETVQRPAPGRPSIYGKKTRTMRVPVEMVDTIRRALEEWARDPENMRIVCISSQNSG